MFVKLDTEYYLEEAFEHVDESAEILFVRARCLAKKLLTNGRLSRRQLASLVLDNLDHRIEQLTAAGLWVADGQDRWQIIEWLKDNLSAEEVKDIRAKYKKAGEASGAARRERARRLRRLEQNVEQTDEQNVERGVEQTDEQNVERGVEVEVELELENNNKAGGTDSQPHPPDNGGEFEPEDPAYVWDPTFRGDQQLAYWSQHIGKVRPSLTIPVQQAFNRLHGYCRRSVREIDAVIEHIARDEDAKRYWGARKSPATWHQASNGHDYTWQKIWAHAEHAGVLSFLRSSDGGDGAPVIADVDAAPPMDPNCDCTNGFRRQGSVRVACDKCARGKYYRDGGT